MKITIVPGSNERLYFMVDNKNLGFAYIEVDGYYVFTFRNSTGTFSAGLLRLIAEKLDELNMDWDASVQKYFDENPQTDTNTDEPF